MDYIDNNKTIENREEYNIKCCDVLKEIIQSSHKTMRFEQILFNIFYDSKINENLSYGREPQNSYQMLINYLEKIKSKKEIDSDIKFINTSLVTSYDNISEVTALEWQFLIEKCVLPKDFIDRNISKIPFIDINEIVMNQQVSHDFLLRFQNKIDWNLASEVQNFSLESLKTFQHLINPYYQFNRKVLTDEMIDFLLTIMDSDDSNLEYLIRNHKINESLLRKHINIFNKKTNSYLWQYISMCQTLSTEFMDDYYDRLDKECIIMCQKLSMDFIWKHPDLNLGLLFRYQELSEEYIMLHIWEIDVKERICLLVRQKLSEENIILLNSNTPSIELWNTISAYQNLSENFIRSHSDVLNWELLSKFQVLSEKLIRDFKTKVYWSNISQYQKLSMDFIQEMKYYVYWDEIAKYQELSAEFVMKMKSFLNINIVAQYQKQIPKEYIDDMCEFWSTKCKKYNTDCDDCYYKSICPNCKFYTNI